MASVLTSLFGDNSVQGLETKSKDILAVFQSTVDGLMAVNVQADKERIKKVEEAIKANEEALALSNIFNKNTKIIEKINGILGE